MAEAFSASCDDLHADKYETADWQEDVPDGWACIEGMDLRDNESPGPVWWLYGRSVQDDTLEAILPTRTQLGLAYDVTMIGNGSADGVVQLLSHDETMLRWLDKPGRGFVLLGEVGANDQVELDGVVTDVVMPGPEVPFPHFQGNEPSYPTDSSLNASGVEVVHVGTDWGRASIHGSYPRLWGTQVVAIDGDVRYLPALEMPLRTSGDPKQHAGSMHASTNTDARSVWTNVQDGKARITIHQAVRLRFDLHLQDVSQSSDCDPCPAVLQDPAGFATCKLPARLEPVHLGAKHS